MVDLRVDPDGLRSAGIGLSETAGAVGVAPRCEPAAADPVSVSIAESLTHWSHVLWALMRHAGRQRAAGGLSITSTADHLGSIDDAGAARIANTTDGGSLSAGTSGPLAPTMAASVPVPTLPAIPQMPAPPPLTGEQFSAMVHARPQPDRVREFANQWRNRLAPHILATADDTRRYSNDVQQTWDDGDPQAAANIAQHADWLESSLYASALRLADSADETASHAETVIHNTPSPQEFRDLRQRLNTALAHYQASGDPSQAIALTRQLGQKQGTAVAVYQTYAAAAPVTTNGAGEPPAPAPPIVRGEGPAATLDRQANELNPGAQRGDIGDGDEHGKGAGGDTRDSSTADFGPPFGPSGSPPVAPAQQSTALTTPTVTGTAANVVGAIAGAGVGTMGQLANSVHGMSGANSPLSALSGLSSLPGLGGIPHMGGPQMPSGPGDGAGDSVPDLGNGDPDFGSGGTTPAGGGGGDGGAAGPVSSLSPAVSGVPSAASPSVGAPAVSAPAASVPAVGGGMIAPPVMGGLGRGNDAGRKPNDKRRVVKRPVVNGEPVFGEVERKHSTRRQRTEER